MSENQNRLFYGFSQNDGNNKSHFRYFCIDTVHDINDYGGGSILETVSSIEDYYFNQERIGDPYYVVFGSLKIDFKESSKFIASFENLHQAITLVQHLTGNPITETEVPVFSNKNEH